MLLKADRRRQIREIKSSPTGSLFVDHVDHDLFVKNTCIWLAVFTISAPIMTA